MDANQLISWLPLLLAFAVSLVAVPVVRWISFRTGKVAKPRPDRWHSQPTPTLGGVGMFVAYAITVGVCAALGLIDGSHWNLLVSSALMFALGLYDDFKQITPPVKMVGQLLAATLVIFFGDVIRFFPWPIANILLTFFWLVGITNAINLLDNMDGLAGGVALIAAGMLAYFVWGGNTPQLPVLALALAGSILGFLVFNFPPARIFMGDSGSLFLGFTLAALAVARHTQASNVFAVMGVPTLLFLLPILDTSLVTITRLLRGQSPAQGGKDHTSHRLIAFGLTERQAVLVLYAIALISGVAAAGLESLDRDISLVLVPLLLIVLSLFAAYLGRLKVVSSYTPANGNLSKLIVNLTYKRRLFEIILDLLLIGFSYYLAYWTMFGLNMTEASMALFLRSWPVAFGAAYASFFLAGIYRSVWRFVGLYDFLRYGRAALGTLVLTAGPLLLLDGACGYPLGVFLLFAIFLLLGLAMSRASFRALDNLYNRRQLAERENVLLYGADDAGEITLRWVLHSPELGYQVLGFLDDDPLQWGRRIHGVDILGGLEQLDAILVRRPAARMHRIAGIILTRPAALPPEAMARLTEACRQRGLWLRVLRLEFELVQSLPPAEAGN